MCRTVLQVATLSGGGGRDVLSLSWLDDRLWCVDFCFHCSLGRPTGALQSLARSDLPEGFLATHTVVADTQDKPFLVDEGQAVWKNALAAAGMADWREQERAEIWEAAAEHFACGNGPMTQGSRSHFRGAPAWIQWPIHPAPACPRCQAPMVFLAQLAEDLGVPLGGCRGCLRVPLPRPSRARACRSPDALKIEPEHHFSSKTEYDLTKVKCIFGKAF